MRSVVGISAALTILCAYAPRLQAQQDAISVQNRYIRINVKKPTGQFQIQTLDGDALTYSGYDQWNSHTIFYISALGNDVFLTNQIRKANPNYSNFAGPNSILQYADTCYVTGDTIRTVWGGPMLRGFEVTQNLYPIATRSAGQAVIQYVVRVLNQNTSNVFKGIFLLLDIAVRPPSGADNCSLDEDKSLMLTSMEYEATPSTSSCWVGAEHRYIDTTGIPNWFLAGLRFPDYGPTDALLGKGTLIGPGLTPPNEFLVGEWGLNSVGMKDSAWNFSRVITNTGSYSDAAVGYKWTSNISGSSTPRVFTTAYGMDDHQQMLSICQNPMMTLVSLTPPDHYRHANGSWDTLATHVDVYIANVDHQGRGTTYDSVHLDLSGAPELRTSQRLWQPPNLPGYNTANLGMRQVGHCSWDLMIDTTRARANTDYTENLGFRFSTSNIPALNNTCTPSAAIVLHQYVPDVNAPQITLVDSTRYQAEWDASDDRAGDTGIDTIVVVRDTNYQFTPPTFTRCDTTLTLRLAAYVIDTTRRGRFVFEIHDCAGNVGQDSLVYVPVQVGVPEGVPPTTAEMRVFPNPLRDEARILGVPPVGANIRVFNALGTDVSTGARLRTDATGARTLDATHLPAGAYQIVARIGRSVDRTTLIVVH